MNINSVALTGNLTRDPELHHTGGGTAVCDLRIAVNGRRRNSAGAWIDDPSFFNVTTFGAHAEACAEYLAKGRPIAVQGRLISEEWEAKDGSGKRFGVKVLGMVQFLGQNRQGDASEEPGEQAPEEEPVAAGVAGGEEDIPF